ncbi:hypothetical protein EXIGLDRAFT_447131 [Exidia glandulosa HHB12029]|uniref:Uncharacterized protein n=1 Tax=Exidia glandulosa HHB12029 TaxID=1314781 RepID=A0A166AXJ5_EXIGL|nr:hypothetical protein EXIGLDRAFT_447131 [Exidia glandulosa HHB12029]
MAAQAPNDQYTTVGFNDGNLRYLPNGAWTDSVSESAASGSTGISIEITYVKSAYVLLEFYGSHLWYYGDLDWNHGNCSIAIDDNEPTILSTNWGSHVPPRVLWDQEVAPGRHILNITNMQGGAPVTVAYFIYTPLAPDQSIAIGSASSTLPSTLPTPPAENSGVTQGTSSMPTSVVAVLSLGIALMAISVALLAFIFIRSRRRKAAQSPEQHTVPFFASYRVGPDAPNAISPSVPDLSELPSYASEVPPPSPRTPSKRNRVPAGGS